MLHAVHVGCIGTSPKGNAHLHDLIAEDLRARSRKPQKTSQADFAMAPRTVLSRRRTNPRLIPRFQNAPDAEILAASFKLSDAQEMVARQRGFDSWQALKTGLSITSRKVKPSPSKATITGAEPQLLVIDIKRSCGFFCKKLGFSVVFSYGSPPYYVQAGRDGARLNLRCVERPIIESRVRDREELLSASVTVATEGEIKLLFLEFQSAGVAFHQTLKRQPWGAKNFVVRDRMGICCCLPDPQTNSY